MFFYVHCNDFSVYFWRHCLMFTQFIINVFMVLTSLSHKSIALHCNDSSVYFWRHCLIFTQFIYLFIYGFNFTV